eukprot:jgi/Chlat1/4122/Chrsp269S03961
MLVVVRLVGHAGVGTPQRLLVRATVQAWGRTKHLLLASRLSTQLAAAPSLTAAAWPGAPCRGLVGIGTATRGWGGGAMWSASSLLRTAAAGGRTRAAAVMASLQEPVVTERPVRSGGGGGRGDSKGVSSGGGPSPWHSDRLILLTMVLFGAPAVAAVLLVWKLQAFIGAAALWACLEVLHLVYFVLRKRRAEELRSQPAIDFPDRHIVLQRILKLKEVLDIHAFIQYWFLGADFKDVQRDNVFELIAHGFFNSSMEELSTQEREQLTWFIEQIESEWQIKFPEGYNPRLTYMAHTREELNVLPRPVIIFLWSHSVAFLTGLVLQAWGYRKLHAGCVGYWYRPPSMQTAMVADSIREPRIFVHGIGVGLAPYLSFLDKLCPPQQPSVIVELPHIAMRITWAQASVEDIVDSLEIIRQRHQLHKACYIAHSYGTFVVTRLHKRYPGSVERVALLDPVCFLLCLPDVCYNFVYKAPTPGPMYWLDFVRWYFCSRELHIAESLCRNFWWWGLQMWPEEMPEKVAVLLSGKDDIVPAALIRKHLEPTHAQVLWLENAPHGGFLFSPSAQDRVVRLLSSL